ncbi:MAG: glutamate 5-kinase [Wenzhouxiangellaceae bacterium]|nr:glutamate 5-kinase [Wenzhouxiangellaceae bacterium]
MTDIRNHARPVLLGSAPLVVKIGSSLLIGADGQPRINWMRALAGALATRPGPLVIVSSGAVALGRSALGLERRPATLAEAQAAAAVGQIRLAGLWADAWAAHDRSSAQMLLTVGDLDDRARYLNARNTLETLLAHGVVPVVNENDTVATGEIRFGDNDRLSARVAQLAGAGLLVLLSDVDGLYAANPKQHPEAERIAEVDRIDAHIAALADGPEQAGVGTGGMISKLAAARIATAAGCPVLLTSGHDEYEPLARFLDEGHGTWFHAAERPLARRKQWLRGLQQQAGELLLDAGAVAALQREASLLARGVTAVQGRFKRGDLVGLRGPDGPVGQGLAGYASDELARIAGRHSEEFEAILGYAGRGAVVHRDDLVIFDRVDSRSSD